MTVQPLPQSPTERRMPLRLLAYWEKLRRDRPMPAESDIAADDILDLWDSCFLIHVKDVKAAKYHYSYVGQNIIDAYRGGLGGDKSADSIIPPAGMIDAYKTVLQTRKPLIESGELISLDNKFLRYRQCLLPLGEANEVQAIFGALQVKMYNG